jgi:hypothetical protein
MMRITYPASVVLFGSLILWAAGGVLAQEIALDGSPYDGEVAAAAGSQPYIQGEAGGEMAPVIDIVGSTDNAGSGSGLAKGNAFRVDLSTGLVETEFWLNFNDSQTLAFYVYQSPVEFGDYTQVYTSSATVGGTGPAWYSSGPINFRLEAGNYYIIAVSWSGTLSYNYGTGDSQVVSFGEQVHGHATGSHPLPATISSTANDQAIYYQRLTTDVDVPVELQSFTAE